MVSYFTLLFLYGLVIWSTSPVSHWSSLRLTRLPRGTSSSTPPPPRDKTWQWPWLIFRWTKWLRARSSATQKLHKRLCEHDLFCWFLWFKAKKIRVSRTWCTPYQALSKSYLCAVRSEHFPTFFSARLRADGFCTIPFATRLRPWLLLTSSPQPALHRQVENPTLCA